MFVIAYSDMCTSYRSISGRRRPPRPVEDRRGLTPGAVAGDAEPSDPFIASSLAPVLAYPPQAGLEPCRIADALTTGAGGRPPTIGRPLAPSNHRNMGASAQ